MNLYKKLIYNGAITLLTFTVASVNAESKHDHKHDPNNHEKFHNFKDAQYWTKKFDHPERDKFQKPKELIELMKIKTGMTIADLGAGTGYLLSYLSHATGEHGQVWALDIEATLIDFMKERAKKEKLKNVKPMLIDAASPQIPGNQFDQIVVLDTWHHLENQQAYFSNIKSALKTGGQIFIVDYDPENLEHGPPLNVRVPPQEVKKILNAAGYEAEILTETMPYHYVVRGTAIGG